MLRLGAAGIIALACVTSCLAMKNVTDMLRDINQTQFAGVLEQAIAQGVVDMNTGIPYTILVPTNDAFNKLTPEERTQITSDATTINEVVKHHIIRGEVFSWMFVKGRMLHSINLRGIRIYKDGQNIYLDDGKVVKADVEATNAVLHLIDTVLYVPHRSIYEVTRDSQYPLSTFADYLDKARFKRYMNAKFPKDRYTVFAPSNDAFARLPSAVVEKLRTSSYYLKELMNYHIHSGILNLQNLDHNGTITTMGHRHDITITVDTDTHLNHVAQLEQADIKCDNGVVHIIDHVLIPATLGPIIG